jgi:hypothetical protein
MSNNGNSDIDDMQYLHDKYKAEEEENDKKWNSTNCHND